MNSDPDFLSDEQADLNRQLIDQAHARNGWKRRAVGVPRQQALDEIPKVGMLQAQIPIEPLRQIQQHIRDLGLDQAKWVRNAIVNHYLREGGDADTAQAALAMQRIQRSRDVPRDQYGQDRRREGRRK